MAELGVHYVIPPDTPVVLEVAVLAEGAYAVKLVPEGTACSAEGPGIEPAPPAEVVVPPAPAAREYVERVGSLSFGSK